ncbi:cytochrome P450 2D6-like isoform X2 [Hyperolius riggenbachi]|uniref:cytochrome P450 2D6-like isoform X2 n=1 Tax=Hyperolius riggenbachi TaxID=752182 RepID=UPI0035A2B346
MDTSIVLLLGFILLVLLRWMSSRPKDFPPGPLALPVLGNILQINFSSPLVDFKELSKVYGPVYSIYLGFTPAVVVRGLKDLKEVLVNKGVEFAGRPMTRLTNVVSGGKGLVLATYGPAWKEHRRFTLSTLRNFGLGKKSMDKRICEESLHLVKEIKKNKVLEEHKRSRVPGQPRDYIDCYLEEMEKEEKDGSKKTFDEKSLFTCMVDLFVAGTETTSSTLEWGLLYMMLHPDIQEKCREEIDNIRVDRDHLDYEDQVRMPYTQAVLLEIQRFSSVVPLGVSHTPIKDVQLNGYTIPKGTIIITDLSSAHYDERHWKYPHQFNPENFFNKDGDVVKVESFMPFSAGPRVCLGENLARMELFLFFTTMLTHFEFHWPDPKSPPDLTAVFGISQVPKPFKMKLVPRTSLTA